MTNHGATSSGAVGGPVRHVPVLLSRVLEALALGRPGPLRILDGTFGAGGYARAILDAAPDLRLLALDRDPDAVRSGGSLVAAYGGRLTLAGARFGTLDAEAEAFGLAPLDGVVLDVGVSSMQLDEGERGFSFMRDGPLDMRMSRDGPSAADLVASLAEGPLADLIFRYGEERRSRAIARAIAAARGEAPIRTTLQLARVVASAMPPQRDGPHPATRTFQALRIAVNDELGELERALGAAERALAPGGRLAVVTFHSLEDRIVKGFLRDAAGRAPGASRFAPRVESEAEPRFRLVGPQPVLPDDAELAANPRARSAKLRVAERTHAPALTLPRGAP